MTPTRDEVVAMLENMAAANEEWAVKNGTGPAKAGAKRDAGIYRLALALLEQGRLDGERYAYCRKGQWTRRKEIVRIEGTGDDARVIEEEWTFLQVRVPNGSNLSCGPMVDEAIDAARTPATSPLRDTPVSPRMGTEKPPETAR